MALFDSGISGAVGGMFAGLWNTILMIILYIAIGIVLVAIFVSIWYFMIYRKRLYNVDCILVVKRAGKMPVIGFDKGGYVTKKKTSRFVFASRKHARIDPPKYEQIYMNEKGRNNIFFYKYGEQDYCPVSLEFAQEIMSLKPISGQSKDAVVQDIREIIADINNPSFWEKYGMSILMIIGIIVIMAGVFLSVSSLTKTLSSMSSTNLQVVEHLEAIINKTTNSGVIYGVA